MYASPIEPWSEYLTGVEGLPPQPYYDPLAFAIEEAHRRGLELQAWFNPFRVRLAARLPVAANHVSRTHPEWIRDYGGQLWIDPGNPEARAYVLRVIMDVVHRYDVDGVHFDDYFYPYPVESTGGYPIPFPDDATWREFGTHSGLSRDDWRRQNINQFVQSVYQSIKATKPWVQFGISPFGIWRPGNPPQIRGLDAYNNLYADSRLWLASGWVDYLSPQLYWPIEAPAQSYPVLLNWWAQQNVKHRNLWPGLDASSAGTKFPVTEIPREIQTARAQGVDGEIFFHLKTFELNPTLANMVAEQYTYPALVPASPWLGFSYPIKPRIAERVTNNGWIFSWDPAAKVLPRQWLLQYLGVDRAWKNVVLPSNQFSQGFSYAPELVSIREINDYGALGPPNVLGEMSGSSAAAPVIAPTSIPRSAPAQAPQTSGSFWNSYKGK
jgi:uncharacterized lipoprotein YddW (UPF0748 family)